MESSRSSSMALVSFWLYTSTSDVIDASIIARPELVPEQLSAEIPIKAFEALGGVGSRVLRVWASTRTFQGFRFKGSGFRIERRQSV